MSVCVVGGIFYKIRSIQIFSRSIFRRAICSDNYMKFRSPLVTLLLFCAVSIGFSSIAAAQNAPLPNFVEPFQISRGKMFAAGSAPEPRAEPSAAKKTFENQYVAGDFEEAVKIIRQNYVGGKKLDLNELTKSSIDAMLRTLDPHSHYFDSAEFNELLTDQQSEYFGIGATIVNYEKDGEINTYVVSAYPDSTADRAHLRFGDKIISVGGENVAGLDSADVRDKVRGKLNSSVKLQIERAGTGKIENIQIIRNRVPQPSLPDAYILRGNVAYIDLTNGFNYTTAEELTAALKELHKQGMESLILDLRDNPGGIVDQAVKVVEKFLPAGSTVLTQRGRYRGDSVVWRTADKSPETVPLVVLVNENTASASEIVSGALQDYDRALIVGDRTFGKGLVQSVISLPYGSGLTLTSARYFTPSGRSIQRDYTKMDFYDYFNHKVSLSESDRNKAQTLTVTGRKVYGGGGIEPDEVVASQNLTAAQAKLLDPLFFFSIDAANGKIAGFENLKVDQPVTYGQRVGAGDFPVNDALAVKFAEYLRQNKGWNIDPSVVQSEFEFIKLRIRNNLATAAFGSVSATQVLIENDPQIARAVADLPRASQLALAARKIRLAKNEKTR